MNEKLTLLKSRLFKIEDIGSAAQVLGWDEATYLPPKGAGARGRQIATLSSMAHAELTSKEHQKLLESLLPWAEQQSEDSDDGALVRVAYRDYKKAANIPNSLVAESAELASTAYMAWSRARPRSDFDSLIPLLEKKLELSHRLAACFKEFDHPLDALMDFDEPGIKVDWVVPFFQNLKTDLSTILKKVIDKGSVDESCLKGEFPEEKQLELGRLAIQKFGFDFERGRQDKTHHPFMTRFSSNDVRITTRVRTDDLADAFFSTVHECGHALYELGIDEKWDGLPIGHGVSTGVHESQSRLWENGVARSLGFWKYFFPKVQAMFPLEMGDVSVEKFYRAINAVKPSLIRVDADELTYNFHIFVRFQIEKDLLEGKMQIRDIPKVWNDLYEETLGLRPPDHKDGCLQDVHWFHGPIGGYFQGYTIGNVLSAQLMEKAVVSHPEIPTQIEKGEFQTLLTWLRKNVHIHGRKYEPHRLIEKACGGPLSTKPYIRYLSNKFLSGDQ